MGDPACDVIPTNLGGPAAFDDPPAMVKTLPLSIVSAPASACSHALADLAVVADAVEVVVLRRAVRDVPL